MNNTQKITVLFFTAMMITGISCDSFSASLKGGEVEKHGDIQYVYPTTNLERYTYPTHINELIADSEGSSKVKAYMVIIPPGHSVHFHKHEEFEQAFYLFTGSGQLLIGKDSIPHAIKPGNFVRIPSGTFHRVKAIGADTVKYLCLDSY
jgi:quercetin dioxygenase-like cupin family protein